MMLFASSGAGWEPWGWGRSWGAMCTFGSIAAHLLPRWAVLWQRNAGVGLAAVYKLNSKKRSHFENDGVVTVTV
jgi:hypothetical protein